ncbi:MAG: hypothetical protein AAFY88_10010 [Acidobacteriota bacterium]
MRLPKQSSQVDRDTTIDATDVGSVAPAGIFDVLKNVGMNALRGALGGVAGGL